jgi:hypothetical protein
MKNTKKPVSRRINLSNSKLLSTYGRNIAEAMKSNDEVKVGEMVKPLMFAKVGAIGKPHS